MVGGLRLGGGGTRREAEVEGGEVVWRGGRVCSFWSMKDIYKLDVASEIIVDLVAAA
jgi:hypothetical protein